MRKLALIIIVIIVLMLLVLGLALTGCTYPFRCSGVFVCGSEREPRPRPTNNAANETVNAVNETEEPTHEPN